MSPDKGNVAVELRLLLTIRYVNHRGESSVRRIVPLGMRFASTEWHPEEQWILDAFDLDKGVRRSFAMKDIRHYAPVARGG